MKFIAQLPKTDSYEPVISRLEELHCQGGYADYWIAYRMDALSHEKLIFVPTGDNDRYKPYSKFAQSLEQPVLLVHDISEMPTKNINLKGISYEIKGSEKMGGLTAMFLRKI